MGRAVEWMITDDMVLNWLDIFGVAVFAVSGALNAGRKQLDIFGVILVGCVTAIGGGTIRDVLTNEQCFWVADPHCLYVAILTSLLTFFFARMIRAPKSVFVICDALGLGAFTVIGCWKSINLGIIWPIAAIMGMITATVGGMIRDVLCGEIPVVLRAEVYATAALVGSVAFIATRHIINQFGSAAAIGIAVTIVLRIASLKLKWSLPALDLVERSR